MVAESNPAALTKNINSLFFFFEKKIIMEKKIIIIINETPKTKGPDFNFLIIAAEKKGVT